MIPNLLKGQLGACITVERAIAISRNPNCRVVFIGDPADYQQIIYNYNMVVGSILLPDYDAMQLDTVGDINAFNNAYFFYLHSNNPSMFLATVLKAMNTGYNICLFFPHEADGLSYPRSLLYYISQQYGITARFGDIMYSYNPIYDSFNAGELYKYDLITPQEYLVYSNPISNNLIGKLVFDLHINGNMNDPKFVAKVFEVLTKYKNNMISAQAVLEKPFFIMGA